MPGRRLAPAYVAIASACCGRPASVSPQTLPEAAPVGRFRKVTFECPGPTPAPRTHGMSCATRGTTYTWSDVDPPRERDPRAPQLPPDDWSVHPCVHGIRICGVPIPAPQGSEALSCADDDGRRHGPIEVLAHDGSLLVQGFCVHGTPSGTWFWWRDGALASTQTYPVIDGGAVSYVGSGAYVYGEYRMVRLVPEIAP